MKYVAGVVTFNPDMERLKENLDALSKQIINIVIFDKTAKFKG